MHSIGTLLSELYDTELGSRRNRFILSQLLFQISVDDLTYVCEHLSSHMFPEHVGNYPKIISDIARSARETMTGNAYHTPIHAFCVALVATLLSRHNTNLTSWEKFLLLIAALGHDLGHDGKGGGMYLEVRAAGLLDDILKSHQIVDKDRSLVNRLVVSTYAPYRWDIKRVADFDELGCLHLLHSSGRAFEALMGNDAAFPKMAALLSDADLLFSIGVGEEASLIQSKLVYAEISSLKDIEFEDMLSSFLLNIAGSDFASVEARSFKGHLDWMWQKSFGSSVIDWAESLRVHPKFTDKERISVSQFLHAFSGGVDARDRPAWQENGHAFFSGKGGEMACLTRSKALLAGNSAGSRFVPLENLGVGMI